MAYARFSNSDLYIYASANGGIDCLSCALGGRTWGMDRDQAVAHVEAHKAAGHHVPASAIGEIVSDPDYRDPKRLVEEVRAFDVRLRLVADGGRKTPVYSGYRCQCRLRPDGDSDATFRFEGVLRPGDTCNAVLIPHLPQYWADVRAGDNIALYEGARLVGYADVRAQVNEPDGTPLV